MSKKFLLIGVILGAVIVMSCGAGGAIMEKKANATDVVHDENKSNESAESPIVEVEEKLNGWQLQEKDWYYYKDDQKQTRWLQDNDKWYYLGNDGKMRTGWVEDEEQWYYMNNNGVMTVNINVDGWHINEAGLIDDTPKQKHNFENDNNLQGNDNSNNNNDYQNNENEDNSNNYNSNNYDNLQDNSSKEPHETGKIVQDSTEAREIIYRNDPGDYALTYRGIYSSGEVNDELLKLYENFIINEPVHVFHYYDHNNGDISCIYYVGKNTGTLYRRDGGYHTISNAHIIEDNQIVKVFNYK